MLNNDGLEGLRYRLEFIRLGRTGMTRGSLTKKTLNVRMFLLF